MEWLMSVKVSTWRPQGGIPKQMIYYGNGTDKMDFGRCGGGGSEMGRSVTCQKLKNTHTAKAHAVHIQSSNPSATHTHTHERTHTHTWHIQRCTHRNQHTPRNPHVTRSGQTRFAETRSGQSRSGPVRPHKISFKSADGAGLSRICSSWFGLRASSSLICIQTEIEVIWTWITWHCKAQWTCHFK